MSLKFFVTIGKNGEFSLATTNMNREKTEREVEATSNGEDALWDHLEFESDWEGTEILESLTGITNVQNMLEDFAATMFKWGQKFERERLRKQLGLE